MQYTEYFSQMICEDKSFKLSHDQLRRMLNIVYVEGCLTEASSNRVRYLRLLRYLTNGEPPNVLYYEMKLLSETYYRKTDS